MNREEAIAILNHKISACLHGTEWGEALDMAIKALEQESDIDKYLKQIDHLHRYISKLETQIIMQEPCDDAISRQAVLELAITVVTDDYSGNEILDVVEVEDIKQLPPVNPQPKIGQWVKHDTGHSIYYDCSLCGCVAPCTETADKILWKMANYCPNCGAKMVKPQEGR